MLRQSLDARHAKQGIEIAPNPFPPSVEQGRLRRAKMQSREGSSGSLERSTPLRNFYVVGAHVPNTNDRASSKLRCFERNSFGPVGCPLGGFETTDHGRNYARACSIDHQAGWRGNQCASVTNKLNEGISGCGRSERTSSLSQEKHLEAIGCPFEK